jgi:hypothetical protein
MLPGIARNKGTEGKIQKAINIHMKDKKYGWRNYNPPDEDEEEEEEDDVPLVLGTSPIRICLFLSFTACTLAHIVSSQAISTILFFSLLPTSPLSVRRRRLWCNKDSM